MPLPSTAAGFMKPDTRGITQKSSRAVVESSQHLGNLPPTPWNSPSPPERKRWGHRMTNAFSGEPVDPIKLSNALEQSVTKIHRCKESKAVREDTPDESDHRQPVRSLDVDEEATHERPADIPTHGPMNHGVYRRTKSVRRVELSKLVGYDQPKKKRAACEDTPNEVMHSQPVDTLEADQYGPSDNTSNDPEFLRSWKRTKRYLDLEPQANTKVRPMATALFWYYINTSPLPPHIRHCASDQWKKTDWTVLYRATVPPASQEEGQCLPPGELDKDNRIPFRYCVELVTMWHTADAHTSPLEDNPSLASTALILDHIALNRLVDKHTPNPFTTEALNHLHSLDTVPSTNFQDHDSPIRDLVHQPLIQKKTESKFPETEEEIDGQEDEEAVEPRDLGLRGVTMESDTPCRKKKNKRKRVDVQSGEGSESRLPNKMARTRDAYVREISGGRG